MRTNEEGKISNLKCRNGVIKKAHGFEFTCCEFGDKDCTLLIKDPNGVIQEVGLHANLDKEIEDLAITLEFQGANGLFAFLRVTFHEIQDNTLKARQDRALLEVEELKKKNNELEKEVGIGDAYYEYNETILESNDDLFRAYKKAEKKLKKEGKPKKKMKTKKVAKKKQKRKKKKGGKKQGSTETYELVKPES